MVLGQVLSGLTTAMFLFMVASGLSLIFGVMRVLNFAHGSLYMVGAYIAWQIMTILTGVAGSFLLAVIAATLCVAVLGGVLERAFFARLYGRPELYQLLLTYALVLVMGDLVRIIWGSQQLSVRVPEALSGAVRLGDLYVPAYSLMVVLVGIALAVGVWLALTSTPAGRMVRAAAIDREMLSALGADVRMIYTGMFMLGAALAGLAGALISPIQSLVPGMDTEVIVQAFIVVVIGGIGSFWGTFLGSLLYGQVLAFGILIFPGFSLFSVYALMAVILIVRPSGLLGRKG
jgi:branched-subunit amino acid ABC-type transport system permease component